MSYNYEARLSTERMVPLVFKMAMPAVAAQLVNLLYGIVDRIYIGHIPQIGTDALAGVGVTTSIILLISAFSAIVGGGGAPLAAIALGQNDRERAGRILGNGVLLLVAFTVVTSLTAYVFMEPLLLLTGASVHTLGYAVDYLSVYLMGTIFVELSTGLNTFINAQGRPAVAMYSVLIGAVLNIALDPLFIFAFGMGVKGAAVATVISQACSAVWVLRFLTSSRASLRIEWRYVRPERKVIVPIVALGVSPFIMASTESLVGFVLNTGLKRFGDIYVSTLTVLQSAMQFGSVPMTGFAQGFVPIVSYNYGHGDVDRVKSCFRVAVTVMFTFNLVLMLFMIFFPHVVASAFTDDVVLIGSVGVKLHGSRVALLVEDPRKAGGSAAGDVFQCTADFGLDPFGDGNQFIQFVCGGFDGTVAAQVGTYTGQFQIVHLILYFYGDIDHFVLVPEAFA